MIHVEQAEWLRDAQPLVDHYDKRIDTVAEIAGDLTDYEAATLAVLLDNTEKIADRYRRMKALSDRSFSESVGPFIKHALNIVSIMYTTFDLKDLISIQALKQKIGALYFLQYTYASNKGNVNAGDIMFDPQRKPTRTGYYSSQEVKQETLSLSESGGNTIGTLAYYPLAFPAEIVLTIVGGSGAGSWTFLSTAGNVHSIQKNESATADGTINNLTGAISITGDITASLTSAKIDYVWNSEKYSDAVPIPKVSISVEEKEIRARRRNMLFDISLDATFDYDNQFGGGLNAQVESATIREMQNELAYMVLDRMFNEASGNNNNTYTFDLTPPATGIALDQHAQRFWKKLSEMSTQIFNNLGRGMGNKIVSGDRLIEFLRVMPNTVWKPEPNISGAKGPYKAGRLLETYDVYHNQVYGRDDFLMTFKGDDWWESPYYVGVYLPLMASKFMLFPDFHGEQGYISMDAHEFLFKQHVVKGTVTESTGS